MLTWEDLESFFERKKDFRVGRNQSELKSAEKLMEKKKRLELGHKERIQPYREGKKTF